MIVAPLPSRSTLRLLICCALKACHGRWPYVFGCVVVQHSGTGRKEWFAGAKLIDGITHQPFWVPNHTPGGIDRQKLVTTWPVNRCNEALQQVCPIQLLRQPGPKVPWWRDRLRGFLSEDQGCSRCQRDGVRQRCWHALELVRQSWGESWPWFPANTRSIVSLFNAHERPRLFPLHGPHRNSMKFLCVSSVSED